MKSVNKVILIGNVGKDPELKYTSGGTGVSNLTLATNERFKDKGGDYQERAEWHSLVVWDKLADVVNKYVKKGSKIYVEGRLQTRTWEKDGVKKYATEVVVSDLVLLDGKRDSLGQADDAGAEVAVPVTPKPIDDSDIPF